MEGTSKGYQSQSGGTNGGANWLLKLRNLAFTGAPSHLSIDASSTNTLKANPNRLAFFAYYRVFTQVPAGSCGLL